MTFASAESFVIRHSGGAGILEGQDDRCSVRSGKLVRNRAETGVDGCERPKPVDRKPDEKAPFGIGGHHLAANELNPRMRQRTASRVDHLARTLCPGA